MKLHTLYLSLLLAATTSAHAMEFSDAELARASALQKRLVTLDSHLDTPANLERGDFDVMQGHAGNRLSQVDYPRMLEGALDGGFWAVYTGQGNRSAAAHLDDRDAGLQRLMKIHNLLAAQPQRFALATTPADAARIKAAGKRVVYISMENASPLVADPSLLRFYYAQGLRLMSTVHFLNNEFADSATDPKGAEWKGLSPAGKQLVQQALGIVIDQSHASDAVFDQLIALSPVPIVLSHSGARAVYNHPRNIDDARLKVLAAHGGVIQVNSYGGYLIDSGASPERKAAEKALADQYGGWEHLKMSDGTALSEALKALDARYPVKRATEEDFFAHLEHVLAVAGPAHVGIGMDWDGGGGVVGLEDVSDLPRITAWLLRKGYSEPQIAGIWGGNLLRVMEQAQAYAAGNRESGVGNR
ncbi:membrane dipeptidase [Xanthomonas campestris pv. campestris]|jgi:membrane dipeptidase|uniref:Dipeptidase n=3 Tax=Xanthomonas campestris pv. campestris TaxID=340 RepID=Q8P350_XANCP|nr:dipeptidase [Xanthomonas campestris]AAM43444.1 dipeptidase [Xanthomonas campestris pv. campestris str. ATCC 33913]AAY51352.1 dipeptidase [Xanthomonas campestris pv. campestris str. 8004]AKS18114.1 peptidase M19 [Xanthomonas campestris pv. campestris]AKS22130.1 peptidase M19 [Xanthomonas campestris pv. campestris]ALE70690.1 peptidase M19 [Xanthomonas campestris pv. campestris]